MLTEVQVIIRLLLSAILGGLVGVERQLHKRTAGLRTHILVTLGSCLIMLTSMYVFDIYINKVPLDPVRIASGVITGIGFLGAGTILREREEVRGLTTAASLWVCAGIGLAVGTGFLVGAFFTTALVLVVLLVLRYFESVFLDKSR